MDESMTMYTTTTNDAGTAAALASFGIGIFVVALLAYVLTALGLMQFFKKAGRPAWAAWVPFYNYYVMTEIADIPMYWFWVLIAGVVLSWVPVVGTVATLVATVYITHKFLQKYGKDMGHTVLAVLFSPIYFPVVGYSKGLTYQGTVRAETTQTPAA